MTPFGQAKMEHQKRPFYKVAITSVATVDRFVKYFPDLQTFKKRSL